MCKRFSSLFFEVRSYWLKIVELAHGDTEFLEQKLIKSITLFYFKIGNFTEEL